MNIISVSLNMCLIFCGELICGGHSGDPPCKYVHFVTILSKIYVNNIEHI